MNTLRCVNCGTKFLPAPQVPNQIYCSKQNCQKERRRQWQKNKLQSDPDYRDNQYRAQRAWSERNPDYWRQRRTGSTNYGNRIPSQQVYNTRKNKNSSIKMDALNSSSNLRKALKDGIFSLRVIAEPVDEKMDSWIVELSSISAG